MCDSKGTVPSHRMSGRPEHITRRSGVFSCFEMQSTLSSTSCGVSVHPEHPWAEAAAPKAHGAPGWLRGTRFAVEEP